MAEWETCKVIMESGRPNSADRISNLNSAAASKPPSCGGTATTPRPLVDWEVACILPELALGTSSKTNSSGVVASRTACLVDQLDAQHTYAVSAPDSQSYA